MDDMTDAEFDKLLKASSVGRRPKKELTFMQEAQQRLTGMPEEQAEWEEGGEDDGDGELHDGHRPGTVGPQPGNV